MIKRHKPNVGILLRICAHYNAGALYINNYAIEHYNV